MKSWKDFSPEEKKRNMIRLVAVCIFLIVSITATITLIPFVQNLMTDEGRIYLQEKVNNAGIWGWTLFLGLQILQVVVALIPGEPVELIGGILFGTWGGLFLCLFGLLIGTLLVFYLVKLVGKPLVLAFVSLEKFEQLKILREESRLESLIFLLFLIPGTPKDTLTYLVPLTKIHPARFFLLSTIARIPSVVSSTWAGATLSQGQWGLTITIFIGTAAIGLLGIFINNKLMERLQKRKNK